MNERKETGRDVYLIRLSAIVIVLLVVPLGLFARSQRSGADPGTLTGFLATYAGDALWPILFYFLARLAFPTGSGRAIFVGVLVFTLGLEFLQLVRLEPLITLRKLPVLGFLLGNTFVWSDVVCLAIGSLVAVAIDFWLRTNTKSYP